MNNTPLILGVEQFDEIVLYGSRGHSQMILTVLNGLWQGRVRLRAVVDDLSHGYAHPLLGAQVINAEDRLARFPDVPVLLSMGDGQVRAQKAAALAEEGAVLATAVNRATDKVASNVQIGAGCIVNPQTLLSPNVSLGTGVQILGAAIGHDVQIGDFSTLAFGVVVNGHVQIGDGCSIGSGAILSNGRPDQPLKIGDGAVIGPGAVILRDVPAGATMIGNPAMTLREYNRLQALLKAQD